MRRLRRERPQTHYMEVRIYRLGAGAVVHQNLIHRTRHPVGVVPTAPPRSGDCQAVLRPRTWCGANFFQPLGARGEMRNGAT